MEKQHKGLFYVLIHISLKTSWVGVYGINKFELKFGEKIYLMEKKAF